MKTNPDDFFGGAASQPEAASYGERADGTPKGKGYFGELKRPDGNVSTEISIGVQLGGKETEIPALVPTLSRQEVNYLLAGNKPTPEIVQKAVDHAKSRMAEGKSPFADDGEQQRARTNPDDFFGAPPAPKAPEPSLVDRVVTGARELLTTPQEKAEPRPPGSRRGGTRTEAKPYVAPDQPPPANVLERPAPEGLQDRQSLIDQRGAPLNDEAYAALKMRLAALPPTSRAAMARRTDLPGWMRSAVGKAVLEIDRDNAATARTGVLTPQASAEARGDALVKQGMRGDVAATQGQYQAEQGGLQLPLAQATAIESPLSLEQEQQAKAAGQALQKRSIGVQGLEQAKLGLEQSYHGGMAAALRAAGDEQGAKFYEAEGAKRMVQADAVAELQSMRQRAEQMGVVNASPAAYLERMGTGAANSVGQMIPGIVAGGATALATGNPVIGGRVAMSLMSSQVFGQEFINGRTQGLSPAQSAGRAGAYAALEYLGERYGLVPQAMNSLTARAAKVPVEELPAWAERAVAAMEKRGLFSKPVGHVVRGQVGEQIGEQLTGAGQYLVDGTQLGLDQPISVRGFLENARDTAVQTLIATGVMQAGGAGAAGVLRGKRRDEAPAEGSSPRATLPAETGAAAAPLPAAAGTQEAPAPQQPAPAAAEAPLDAGALLGTPLDEAAHAAATSPTNDRPEPTPAQKDAGNYAKGHIKLGGLDVSIENPQGSVRRGTDEDGKAWESTLQHHYGYIRRTEGADGDHVDVFVKPGTTEDYAGPVFVVDQRNPKSGAFDEHKVMLGFDSPQEAETAYRANYAPGWQGMGYMTGVDMPAFKEWLRSGDTKRPFSAGFKEGTDVDQRDVAGDAREHAAPAAGPGDLAGGSSGAVGSAAAAPERVVRPAGQAAPGAGQDAAVLDAGGSDAALSDKPDFERTFPRPQFEALATAGRLSAFEGMQDDPRYLSDAVRGVHQETATGLHVDAEVARALRAGLAAGTDPATGKPAKPERLDAMRGELQRTLASIDGTLDEYASEFGDQHAQAFAAHAVPDLETLRQPVDDGKGAAREKAAAAVSRLGKLLGKNQPAPTPQAEAASAALAAEAPAAPVKKAKAAPSGPFVRTIQGSDLLARVNRWGGISPGLMSELSHRRLSGLKDAKGKQRTIWHNPSGGKGVGGLFRDGGRGMDDIALQLEDDGYLPPGTYEREGDEPARKLIRRALNGGGDPARLQDLDAEMTARMESMRQEAEQTEYPELDPEAAAEADAERAAIMAENNLSPAEMQALDDADLAWDVPGNADPAAAMRALGFSEQEIADELAQQEGPDQGRTAPQRSGQAREDGSGREEAPAAPGEGAPRPAGEVATLDDRVESAIDTMTADQVNAVAEALQLDANRPKRDTEARRGALRFIRADKVAEAMRAAGVQLEAPLLQAYDEADLRARAEAEQQQTDAERRAETLQRQRAQRQREDRENRARADQTVDDFQLGQTAEQQMSGVGDLFAQQPNEPAPPARDERLIELRKRLSVLKSLRECLG